MEPVKAKIFVMFVAWYRVEADPDHTFNKIPETFLSIWFVGEAINLHV